MPYEMSLPYDVELISPEEYAVHVFGKNLQSVAKHSIHVFRDIEKVITTYMGNTGGSYGLFQFLPSAKINPPTLFWTAPKKKPLPKPKYTITKKQAAIKLSVRDLILQKQISVYPSIKESKDARFRSSRSINNSSYSHPRASRNGKRTYAYARSSKEQA